MAFSVNPNSGPSRVVSYSQPGPQAAVEATLPQQTDQVQIGNTAPPASAPTAQVLNNGLQLQPLSNNGQMTGLYATLPGGPGGLLATPVLVSISTLPGQNTMGVTFQSAKAYAMGADGKVLRDAQGLPQELPATVMSDGRIYVETKSDDPRGLLAMLDSDGSYGLATPAKLHNPADTQGAQGYLREQTEFIKPDNTRGFRLNEEVGAFGQAQSSGLASMMTMGLASTPGGARDVTYTEVQQTPNGALESRDLHFTQTPDKNWPQFSQGGSQWKSLLAMNSPDARVRSVIQEGPGFKLQGGWSSKRMLSLFTGKAGLGANSWTYGKQETIYFVPLSQQAYTTPPTATAATPVASVTTPPPLPDNF